MHGHMCVHCGYTPASYILLFTMVYYCIVAALMRVAAKCVLRADNLISSQYVTLIAFKALLLSITVNLAHIDGFCVATIFHGKSF